MAGSFGFDAEKYEVSQRIAEHQLIPAMHQTDEETLIITNGFSCKEQVAQATGRETLNMAEVLALALDEGEPTLDVLASSGRTALTEAQFH